MARATSIRTIPVRTSARQTWGDGSLVVMEPAIGIRPTKDPISVHRRRQTGWTQPMPSRRRQRNSAPRSSIHELEAAQMKTEVRDGFAIHPAAFSVVLVASGFSRKDAPV